MNEGNILHVNLDRDEENLTVESAGGDLKMLKALGQVLFSSGLQGPRYTQLDSEGKDYEIRTYESASWVSTAMKGAQADAAVKEGFGRLFKYIQGDNEKKEKVEMTAPVTCRIEPGSGPGCETTFTVSFFLPQQNQADPPKPSSPDVFIEERPQFTAFVRTYGGFTNDQLFLDERQRLSESLRRAGVSFRTEPCYRAGYDPPFKLTHRRNEVWILQ